MKKLPIYLFICAFVEPCTAVQIKSVGGSDDNLGSLRNEIVKLESQLEQKTQMLNKCAEKNKNFQVAGIATVGLAGVGVATNVSLYSKMKAQTQQNTYMTNQIQNNYDTIKDFEQDLDDLSKNLDDQCFRDQYHQQLTYMEQARFEDLYTHRYNLEKYIGDEISESDKTLFTKIIHGMQKCQKHTKK